MPGPFVDLRSDTVTKPSAAMRKAMHDAEVGDDVYREDPTVNRLQDRAAEIFGREAGLYVVSGTMGNQTAIKVLTRHGQEVICEDRCHIYNYEMGMVSAFSGVVPRTVHAEDGILTWDLIAPHIRRRNDHRARTGLIELENSSNLAGGAVYPLAISNDIVEHAHAAGLPVHLDGARIFNCRGGPGETCRGNHEEFRLGNVLPFEGTGRAGRIHACRQQGIHRGGANRPEDAWRGDASSRRVSRRQPDCAGGEPQATPYRPRQRQIPGSGVGADSGNQD